MHVQVNALGAITYRFVLMPSLRCQYGAIGSYNGRSRDVRRLWRFFPEPREHYVGHVFRNILVRTSASILAYLNCHANLRPQGAERGVVQSNKSRDALFVGTKLKWLI